MSDPDGRYWNKKHTKIGNSSNFQNYPGRPLYVIPKVPGAFWTLRVCPGTRRPPDLAWNLLKWAQVVLGPTWGGPGRPAGEPKMLKLT